MASLNQPTASTAGRKIRRLGIGVAIAIALYTAGWYYAANRLEGFLNNALVASAEGPVAADCNGLSVGGFPFLIGVTCEKTGLLDQPNGIKAAFEGFRSAARIYMPGTAIVEIDGPAQVSSAYGVSAKGDWQSLRASLSANLDGLKKASFEGRAVTAKIASDRTFQSFNLAIGHPELHVRANGDDLDIALLTEDVDFSMEGFIQPLPRLSASADLTLVGKSHVLNGKAYGGKETSGELRALKVDMGQGMYAELSGPFSIDAEGWVSGSLVLYVENLDLWEKTLLTGFPEASGTISGMSEMLRGLTKGRDKVSVNLSIDKGTIMLSLIPIGHIPQI